MAVSAAALAGQALVVVAALAAYHWVVRRDAPPRVEPESTAPPSAAASSLPPVAASPGFVRFEELERRVASLERALANSTTLLGAASPLTPPSTSPSLSGSQPPGAAAVWTEEQLSALRAMLAEVEMRKNQENYAGSMRAAIKEAAKSTPVSEDAETRAIALLVAFQRRVAELFPAGSGGSTAEEREKSFQAAQKSREALEEELRRVLPGDVATAILSRVPTFPMRLETDRPTPPMSDR